MITLELISRKRKPIKRYAFYGILTALLLMVLIVVATNQLSSAVKISLMVLAALILVISIYILNYSVGFKNVIGNLTFYSDRVEIEFLQKKEVIHKDHIRGISFRLSGYEGFNDSTLFENAIWFPSLFWYHSGLNNFVYIRTIEGVRIFEVFIPDRKTWKEVKKMTRLVK